MNFGIIGPNGAGKSTLLRKLIERDGHIIPFSFANAPIEGTLEAKKFLSYSAEKDILIRRIRDLNLKWGKLYERKLFPYNGKVVMDEIFLTKLLRKAPIDMHLSRIFSRQFQESISNILGIESNYIDRYIYVKPNVNLWRENILRRPTTSTNVNNNVLRYQIQNECLDFYVSQILTHDYIVIENLERRNIELASEFVST